MLSQGEELQAIAGAVSAPNWLQGLIRAVQREGLQPKDARVKSLWDLLRQHQLLGRSRWLQAVLRRFWSRGLAARPRPRTTARLLRLLRRWGILPASLVSATARRPIRTRPITPGTVRSVQAMAVQPMRRVKMRPVAVPARRR
jgi:hypothetical protein